MFEQLAAFTASLCFERVGVFGWQEAGEGGTAWVGAPFGEALLDPQLLVFMRDVEYSGAYVIISAVW